jgi:hypothetical protein
MEEMMLGIMRTSDCPEELKDFDISKSKTGMYVITTRNGINGSALLLYNDIFEILATKLDSDIYILPSSVHELLAVKANMKSLAELKEMVLSVNETVVSNEDFLSNNVYLYRRSTRKVELCK